LRVALLFLALVTNSPLNAQDDRPTPVEPWDLTRRPELVGREVVVDDRVSRIQYHKETGLFDQIFLKRCPEVPFDLPSALRFKQSPQAPAVVIRGVLRRDGDHWHVDVTGVDLQPSDLDRLNSAVATLSRVETEKRTAWARWAELRAKAFEDVDQNNELARRFDEALLQRAREIEAEAIRVEAERPGRDPAARWLALATRARERRLPEPEPSALAHRAFRAALAASGRADELKSLVARIEEFFPNAKEAAGADTAGLDRWKRSYANDPAEAYRKAPDAARRALDHDLWADAVQKSIEKRSAEQPGSTLALAEDASTRLPDRPGVGRDLLERGLARAGEHVGALRLDEVEALARIYQERLNQPEKARALRRAWLDDQREHRLSPHDAEGRVALAGQYQEWLDDRATAVALLHAARAIDPRSREVSDAFLRLGFRKVDGRWVEPNLARSDAPSRPSDGREGTPDEGERADQADTPEPSGPSTRSGILLNATPEQVLTTMGSAPTRKIRCATQGGVIEQWVYAGERGSQHIDFLLRPGDTRPRVVSYFTLPRARLKGPTR
jgi:hypothetical protein